MNGLIGVCGQVQYHCKNASSKVGPSRGEVEKARSHIDQASRWLEVLEQEFLQD